MMLFVGDIIYNQTLSIISGKNTSNNTMTEKDFEIYPAENLSLTDFNENVATRFAIPPYTTDMSLCTGTLSEIKVLVIRPSSNLQIKFINTEGVGQNITLLANRTSVLHASLTGITVTNTTGSPIKGLFYAAGD